LFQGVTIDKFIRKAISPNKLFLPLLDPGIGIPLRSLVRPGDTVRRGQVVAEATDESALPLHAPVRGEVIAMEPLVVPWAPEPVETIVILPGKEEPPQPLQPSKGPWEPTEIRELLYRLGVLSIKLKVGSEPIRTVVVNGCELEPFLTSTQRLMEERTKELISGMEILLQAFEAEQAILAVTTDKDELIADLQDLVFVKKRISFVSLPPRYPQDNPQLILRSLTPRTTATIVDVPTAIAAHEAIVNHHPLLDRVVTLSGPAIRNPQNLEARIGTLLSELIAQCDGFAQPPGLIIMGGPMRGQVISSLEIPIHRQSTGFVFFPRRLRSMEEPCIYCGKCIDACPQALYPVLISTAVKSLDWDSAESLRVRTCLLCGTCSYVCPSRIAHQRYLRRVLERRMTQ
jgi:electron transport complex protein RnfC